MVGRGSFFPPLESVVPPDLNREERLAVAALERLAKRWPQSLRLFSWSGSLCVMKEPDASTVDEALEVERNYNDYVVAHISGIPNDGGDP